MPCRVMGSRSARSVAVAGPAAASSARIARRFGSARATKTCSAIASLLPAMGSGGIEVAGELVELHLPAVGVAAERAVVLALGQLREAGLDHRQPGARRGGIERELDIGTAMVI